MTDPLRKAAEMALEALELFCECGTMDRPIERREALRQALAQPKWVNLEIEEIEELSEKVKHFVKRPMYPFPMDAFAGAFATAIENKVKEKNCDRF